MKRPELGYREDYIKYIEELEEYIDYLENAEGKDYTVTHIESRSYGFPEVVIEHNPEPIEINTPIIKFQIK